MATLGEQFKAAREAKGVSESEAAAATKILTKIIVAMEADDFSVIAAPTYAKGFIRLYAKYLELNPEPLVEEYVKTRGSGPRRLIDKNSQLEQNTQDSRIFPSRSSQRNGTRPGSFTKLAPIRGLITSRIKKIPLGPLKDIRVAAGIIAGLVVIIGISSSISTCVRRKNENKPAPLPAKTARMLLDEELPNLYLVEPGKIESN